MRKMKENIKNNGTYVYLLWTILFSNIIRNKEFWGTIKFFLTNNVCMKTCDIKLISDDEIVADDKKLVKRFNEYYISIIENSLVF